MGGMIPLGDASRRLRRWPIITVLLILANIYVFTRELIYGDRFVYYFSAIPVYIVSGSRWWTIFTAMFLHSGWLHIIGNMIFFWAFGPEIEDAMGRWRFLLFYLATGIAGSAGAILLSPGSVTVGASGAIFGVLGGLLVLERERHIATGGQVAGLIVLNLVITFAFSTSISVGGHVGGLIGGMALMLALLQFRRSALYSVASVLALTVVSLVVAYAKVRNYQ